MTWKSIKEGARYKVYAASTPSLKGATSIYSFNLDPKLKGYVLSTSFDLTASQSSRMTSHSSDYRFWAMKAIDQHEIESPLSEAIDSNPVPSQTMAAIVGQNETPISKPTIIISDGPPAQLASSRPAKIKAANEPSKMHKSAKMVVAMVPSPSEH
jgi:hypothetical protein